MSKLQENFINYFKDSIFTLKEAHDWYCRIKTNPDRLPQRSEIYGLILNPLLHRGMIKKISRGVYQVANPVTVKQAKGQEDDWDSYISSKLKRKEVI